MNEDEIPIVNFEMRRRLGGLRLQFQELDGAGNVVQEVGLYIEGDLPLDPWRLQDELERLAGGDAEGVSVSQLETRGLPSAAQEVVHFIIESGVPEFLSGYFAEKAIDSIYGRLKEWAKKPDSGTPEDLEQALLRAVQTAREIALNAYRDVESLTVSSHSLSEGTSLAEASAMVVFTANDGSVISVLLSPIDGGYRHSITRTNQKHNGE